MQTQAKPKILVVLNRLDIGGTAINTMALCNGLLQNFEVLILYGAKESNPEAVDFLNKQYPGLLMETIPSLTRGINMFQDWVAYKKILNAIRQFHPQIVHTHGLKAGVLGRWAGYRLKTPVRIHTYHGHFFHSYFNPVFTKIIILAERKLGRISSYIIALSNKQKEDLTSNFKIVAPQKIKIIPLGIQVENFIDTDGTKRNNFRNNFHLNEQVIAIGIIGRTAAIKNHKFFLDAAIELLSKNEKNIKFFIIGDGEETNHLKQYLQQKKITFGDGKNKDEKIIFTSWYTKIEEVQNGLDIVVLTSHNEGTPLSVMEAQYCGKPVVSTNVGGVGDIMLNEKTGFLVPENNKKMLIEKLRILINDERIRTSMGAAAKEFAAENFSMNRQVSLTENFYMNTLTEKNII